MLYWVLFSGLGFFCFGAALLISDLRGLKRRERAFVTCKGSRSGEFGETIYDMGPVVRNGKVAEGSVRGKSLGIRVGHQVEVVYDPKHPHRMHLVEKAPRLPTLPVTAFFAIVGVLLSLYGVIRFG
ncbi:DUF3592 domain-containing protein [Streptomyces sp. NPDC087851]|uniref:DUF3592 domain-containing protein n=1 Tax=Streptomyces sp. NPDC087851 TaxID=3365810 RepID=UPI0037F31AFF